MEDISPPQTAPQFSAAEIYSIRQDLGLSRKEFDWALGYATDDGRITTALETGQRGGKPFQIANAAATALKRLQAIYKFRRWWEQHGQGGPYIVPQSVLDAFWESMPEKLR